MELRQFVYFLRACDYGSVAAAAERIGTVQSNVSMQISQLEHEMGAELCKRSGTQLSTTLAGEQFYRLAERLTADVEYASRYIRCPLDGKRARVTLAAAMMPRGSVMAEALREVAIRLGIIEPHIDLRIVDFLAGAVSSNDEIGAVVEASAGSEMFDLLEVRDRWGLITRRGQTSLPPGEVAPADLASFARGLKVILPKMPPRLDTLGKRFAEAAGLALANEDFGIHEIEAANFGSNRAVLIPLGCMPGFSVQHRFQVTFSHVTDADPVWRVERAGQSDPRLIQVIGEIFHDVMHARLPGNGSAQPQSGGEKHGKANESDDSVLTFRYLRVFDAVFERGNISRAADDLNISQPAISNSLKKLERCVGHKLFARAAHGVVPTERALALHALCEPILQDLAEAKRHIRDLGRKGPTPIRIGLLPILDDKSLLAVTISGAISEWESLATGCELRLTEGFNARLRRLAVQEMLDFAIVDSDARQSGLIVTPLSRDAMVVVTNPGLGILPAGPLKAGRLNDLKLVLPSERHGLRSLIQKAFREAGIVLCPKLEVDSMAMTLNLVKSDGWATVLPVSSIYQRVQSGEFQINVIAGPVVTRSLSLVQRAGTTLSPDAKRFMDLLAGHVRAAEQPLAVLEPSSSNVMALLTD